MSPLSRVVLSIAAVVSSLAVLGAAGAAVRGGAPRPATGGDVEVVVTLPQPPLAEAVRQDRTLAAATTHDRKLDLRTPASVSYLRTLASAQRTLQARVATAIPQARFRWRYDVVLNGMAVVVPRTQLARLRAIPGATVWPSVTYHALLNRTPKLIGATAVWGPTFATAGNGMKIGIIDDGVDQTHEFFDPSGFQYPPGFPKGNTAYTTPKVIVARAFPSASTTWKYAKTPFDPQYSDHATHVAGIAAGDHDVTASGPRGRVKVSGIAPNAYLGNYKALTVPTRDFGLDGNSPEITAAIEQAVKDGMDVINLSLGEPEIPPSRDIVVKALNAAADAGVVPVVAAGNDFAEAGRGSVGSPANAEKAIAVAASSEGDGGPADEVASFSSSGPTPMSLQLKPDVTAPGENILSSLPHNTWDAWDGTSMASPHVAGAAALLKERHPSWTVEQIKSALESTGDPVHVEGTQTEVPTTREGGGRIDVVRADNPLVFTDPTGLSFGLVRRGQTLTKNVSVVDAGGGPAPWTVTVRPQSAPRGAAVTATPTVAAPGTVTVTTTVAADAAEGEATGFLTLTRGTDARRIPYWFHVEVPRLAAHRVRTIAKPGVYRGDTKGQQSLVSTYRYPERTMTSGVPADLPGPEQVFRFKLTRQVANFGAVVLTRAPGVRVSPRLVYGGDENRLVGYTGLPVDINPYGSFDRPDPVVGAVLPDEATYDIVFDTPAGAHPGRFLFRFWVNDTTPPAVRLLARSVAHGAPIRVGVRDSGSGVDPRSLEASVDGSPVRLSYAHGVVSIATASLRRGVHRVSVTAADFQETKNMEDVGPVLPNTRVLRTSVTVR